MKFILNQCASMKIMSRFSIFIVLLFMVFSINAKPLPSLSMKMNWTDGIAYEQPVKIHVEVVSQISSDNMNFKLSLPDGVTLIDGSTSFQQKIEKGQPLSLDFTLFIEKNAVGQIDAVASIGNSSQVFFRAARKLIVENIVKSQKSGSHVIKLPAYRHTERNGVKLREYQLP